MAATFPKRRSARTQAGAFLERAELLVRHRHRPGQTDARLIVGAELEVGHSFADRMAFYRSIYDMEENLHEPLFAALGGEPLVYAVPAVAAEDVPGFRKSVGHVLLTRTRLIFASNGQKIEFPLESFNDANVKDGKKYMELKLIFDKRKPQFHLLGISRDHAQEIFMKMHAFRVAIRETNP